MLSATLNGKLLLVSLLAAWVVGESQLLFVSDPGSNISFKEGYDFEPFPLSAAADIRNGELVDIGMFGCESLWYIPQLIRKLASKTKPKVMLIRRGGCKFQDKLELARFFGASAALVYNQGDESDRFGLASNPYIKNNYGLAVYFLTNEAGLKLKKAMSLDHVVVMKHSPVEGECLPFRVYPVTSTLTPDYTHEVVSVIGENHTKHYSLQELRLTREELLFKVVAAGYYYAASRIIQEIGIGQTNSEGQGVLHVARSPEMIAFLISKNADIELRDKLGTTPLVASIRSDQPQAVKALLEYGADPNSLVSTMSPLIYACQTHAGMCSLLLDAGADPNFRPVNIGESALHRAVKRNDLEVVEVLLRANASTTNKNIQGKPPLHYAKNEAMKVAFAMNPNYEYEEQLDLLISIVEKKIQETKKSETGILVSEAADAYLLPPMAAGDFVLFGFLAHDVGPLGGTGIRSYFRNFFKLLVVAKIMFGGGGMLESMVFCWTIKWSLNRSTKTRRFFSILFFLLVLASW